MVVADPITVPRNAEFPRRFVPAEADCGAWETVEPLLLELEAREIDSRESMERWLMDLSELEACVDEEGARRHIAMTCATDDAEREQRYLDFITELIPKSKPHWLALTKKHLDCPHRAGLDADRFFVFNRAAECEVALYREENIPLETRDSRLRQQYQKIIGAMTVDYRGEELPLPRLRPFLEETDRTAREEVWRLERDRRMRDSDALEDLYDEMIGLRDQIARNAGFANYLEYAFPKKGRFDYTPRDCRAFHEAIEEACVPLMKELREERRTRLGVESLRPWDLAVDAQGRPPLRPFRGADELLAGCRGAFAALAPAFAAGVDEMASRGLLDLESRKGKAPGGYQSTLEEVRLPFIFMNAAGTDGDVYTLLHECGHAFHALAARDEPLTAYRHAPTEFCEVASMSMELTAGGYLGEFYSEAEQARSRRSHLEDIIRLLPWIAQIDAFQHWIYTHPEHSREERRAQWLELDERFGPGLNWSGLEDWRARYWQRQLHLFEVPLYYVEYGIAQLGALQAWRNYSRTGQAAIDALRAAFVRGGSRPLPELFETAGLRFDFSAATLRPLIDHVREELANLPE